MKRLSDYKGDEAIELWADLIDPLAAILSDKKIASTIQSGKPKVKIAKEVLVGHKKEAVEILLRIDPEPVNGLNIILRLVNLLTEIGENEDVKSFFGFAEQAKKGAASSGYVMESTGVEEK